MGTADTIIAGGGIIGLGIAWTLASRGQRVVLLEREQLGAGSSGGAAGMLGWRSEHAGAGVSFKLARRANEGWTRWTEAMGGPEAVGRVDGTVWLVPDAAVSAFERTVGWTAGQGLDVETLYHDDLEGRVECAPDVVGYYFQDEASVNPAMVIERLGVVAEAAGVTIHRGVEVEALVREGDRVTGLRVTTGETFSGDQVVLATGVWATELDGLVTTPPVRPIRGQLLHVETDAPAHNVRYTGGYVVPRGHREAWIGSIEEDVGFDDTTTERVLDELRERAGRHLPHLLEAPRVGAWAGLRPMTPDRLPLVGAGALDGLFFALGHGRNGVLLATATADALAEWIVDGAPSFEIGPWDPGRYGL